MNDEIDKLRSDLRRAHVAIVAACVVWMVSAAFMRPITFERDALRARNTASQARERALVTENARVMREMLSERVQRLICERDAALARAGAR